MCPNHQRQSGVHFRPGAVSPDGASKYVGKLGADFSWKMGQAAAQLCAINLLSRAEGGLRAAIWTGWCAA